MRRALPINWTTSRAWNGCRCKLSYEGVLSGPSNLNRARTLSPTILSCSASPADGAEYNDRALSLSSTPIGGTRHPTRGGSQPTRYGARGIHTSSLRPNRGPTSSRKSNRLCFADGGKTCTLSDNPLICLESLRKAFARWPADIQAPQ